MEFQTTATPVLAAPDATGMPPPSASRRSRQADSGEWLAQLHIERPWYTLKIAILIDETYQAFAKGTSVFKPTRTIACRVLQIIGICVAWSVAPDRAYRVLWRILSILFPILQTAYRVGNLTDRGRLRAEWRALMLEQALTAMARVRPGLKIPVESEGMEIVTELLDRGEPVLLCTGHFALTRAAFSLLEPERRPVLIADYNEQMYERNWLLTAPVEILRSGIDVLVRALPLLQSGRLLISFVDYRVDHVSAGLTCISPNIFRLAARAGANIFFLVADLKPDGRITVKFHAPHPGRISTAAEANECATQFAEFAARYRGWQCVVGRRKSLAGSLQAAAWTRLA